MGDSVRVALAVNASVTAVKAGAAVLSGSPAMAAETAHSLVDCTTQGLLWVGAVRDGARPGARYRWGVAAAVVMFGSGGVWSLVSGVAELVSPSDRAGGVGPWVALGVLAVASCLELGSMVNAVRSLSRSRCGRGWLAHLRATEDTASKTVVMEDGADILGNVVAAVAIGVSAVSGAGWVDALGSIAVGGLLCGLACELAAHNVRLLRGEEGEASR